MYFHHNKELGRYMQKSSNWIVSKLTFMVNNEVGEYNDLRWTTSFLISKKYSFDGHTDKSPTMCTHVEQIVLFKAELLLNIDVASPFLKIKILPKTVVPFSVHLMPTHHCQGGSASPAYQMPVFILIDSPHYPTRAPRRQWLSECPS